MPAVVKTRIVKIGNSQGVRIPKVLLDQANLGGEVELELRGCEIVVRPAYRARRSWEDQFKAVAEQDESKLIGGNAVTTTAWVEEEWEW